MLTTTLEEIRFGPYKKNKKSSRFKPKYVILTVSKWMKHKIIKSYFTSVEKTIGDVW